MTIRNLDTQHDYHDHSLNLTQNNQNNGCCEKDVYDLDANCFLLLYKAQTSSRILCHYMVTIQNDGHHNYREGTKAGNKTSDRVTRSQLWRSTEETWYSVLEISKMQKWHDGSIQNSARHLWQIVSHCQWTFQSEGHSMAGWGIGGSVIAADCGVRSPFIRAMGCRYMHCATCVIAGQCPTLHCKPLLFWFPCKRRYINIQDQTFNL